jgi:hypothetical protein
MLNKYSFSCEPESNPSSYFPGHHEDEVSLAVLASQLDPQRLDSETMSLEIGFGWPTLAEVIDKKSGVNGALGLGITVPSQASTPDDVNDWEAKPTIFHHHTHL